jgi:hypothetical protein
MARDLWQVCCAAGFDMWKLNMDAGAVMAMRTAKIAQGGRAAVAEANLMVSEKVGAAVEAQIGMVAGSFGRLSEALRKKLLRHYAAKVRANGGA